MATEMTCSFPPALLFISSPLWGFLKVIMAISSVISWLLLRIYAMKGHFCHLKTKPHCFEGYRGPPGRAGVPLSSQVHSPFQDAVGSSPFLISLSISRPRQIWKGGGQRGRRLGGAKGGGRRRGWDASGVWSFLEAGANESSAEFSPCFAFPPVFSLCNRVKHRICYVEEPCCFLWCWSSSQAYVLCPRVGAAFKEVWMDRGA